jgi:hypothetical protein
MADIGRALLATACAVLVFTPARLAAQTGRDPLASYYVSAGGNDQDNGLQEARAFRSLGHAVSQAAQSDTIKTVTVIGTLNQASEGGSFEAVFLLMNEADNNKNPILITGLPNASARRRAVLSASGTQKDCIHVSSGKFRFEHIEISGSRERGLTVGLEADVTLGPGSLVRDNQSGGVLVNAAYEEYEKPGSLTLDGGIVENNTMNRWGGGGIHVAGVFTMKQGSVRNNRTVTHGEVGSMGGGIFVERGGLAFIEGGDISGNTADYGGGLYDEGHVTMSGGLISGNTAAGGGGVWVCRDAVFNRLGGTVSGNKAPEYANIYAARDSE